MNVKLLKRIIRQIRKEPKRLFMSLWVRNTDKIARCRTSACIAGHAVLLDFMDNTKGVNWREAGLRTMRSPRVNYETRAQRLLRLTERQSERLFYSSYWPEPFRTDFENEKDRRVSSKVAIARIEHFIKTGQ